jgi:Mg-chelatase subunit ChlD
MNQTKPPMLATQPPPLPAIADVDWDNNNSRWLILAAAIVGLLIAPILLGLFLISGAGGGNDQSGSGGSKAVVAASLSDTDGAALGAEAGAEATSGSTQQNSVGDEANAAEGIDTQAVSKKPSSETGTETQSGNDEKESKESITRKEAMLLIYDAKPIPPQVSAAKRKSSSSATTGGGKSADLAAKGGSNPFIGEGAPAKSTVFVIDVSGSMQNQDRLPRVVSSMKYAIEKLKPDQKFTVILFDSNFHTAPKGSGLLLATVANKDYIYKWLDNAPGGGGTNPAEAMNIAIQEKPERIVLLSDGEFDPYCVDAITQANNSNRRPSKIDCVGLVEEVETLKEIASQNKGIYYQAN